MTTPTDLTCSRCGASVGNGGLDKAARITDLDADGLTIVQRFLGRECGCVSRVLTKRALAADLAVAD